MNPQTNSHQGFDLPQGPTEANQSPLLHAPQTFHAPTAGASHFDVSSPTVPSPMTQPSSYQAPILSAPQQTHAPALQPVHGAVQSRLSAVEPQIDAPGEEADTPVDEEWVGKAKDVIRNTHSDPYLQTRELNRLKAYYIKARYNKEIKVDEKQ